MRTDHAAIETQEGIISRRLATARGIDIENETETTIDVTRSGMSGMIEVLISGNATTTAIVVESSSIISRGLERLELVHYAVYVCYNCKSQYK